VVILIWRFGGFHLRCQIKRREKPTNSCSLLTRNEVEEANKAVAKVLEWKMVQQVPQVFFLKMERQHK